MPWFSPIHVTRLTPLKTGRGLLELEFFHAFYAQGVQDFKLQLKVIHRAENFMAGRIMDAEGYDRLGIISHMEFGWLEKFCPELIRTIPPDSPGNAWYDSVSIYLNSVFFQQPASPAQPEDPNDGSENAWLMACALRFDGYACAANLGMEQQPYHFCTKLLGGQMPVKSMEQRLTAMFMLQRFLMKEGVRSKTDRGWKMFRELFLELASEPIPAAYRTHEYSQWERDFLTILPAGMALIRHLHQTTIYDVDGENSPR